MNEEKAKELMRRLIAQYEREIAGLKEEKDAQKKEYAEMEEMKSNPYYGDIDEVRGRVLEYAAEHGLSPREAYGALFAEKKADEEQRRSKNIGALSQEGNAGGDDFEEGALSRDEYWAAKKAGMSLQEYLRYKKR